VESPKGWGNSFQALEKEIGSVEILPHQTYMSELKD